MRISNHLVVNCFDQGHTTCLLWSLDINWCFSGLKPIAFDRSHKTIESQIPKVDKKSCSPSAWWENTKFPHSVFHCGWHILLPLWVTWGFGGRLRRSPVSLRRMSLTLSMGITGIKGCWVEVGSSVNKQRRKVSIPSQGLGLVKHPGSPGGKNKWTQSGQVKNKANSGTGLGNHDCVHAPFCIIMLPTGAGLEPLLNSAST